MMEQMPHDVYDKIEIGAHAIFKKTVSGTDIMLYAGMSGDFSPHHMDELYAAHTRFKHRVAHPMLIGTMVGATLFRLFPSGTRMISRNFSSCAPVFVNDTVTVLAEVTAKHPSLRQLEIAFKCYNQHQELVMTGNALEAMDMHEQEKELTDR